VACGRADLPGVDKVYFDLRVTNAAGRGGDTCRVKRLEAEQVIPALRAAEAQALRAAGDAAIEAEPGRAQGEALAALYAAWSSAGPRAREVFLIQQIDGIAPTSRAPPRASRSIGSRSSTAVMASRSRAASVVLADNGHRPHLRW